MGAALGNILMNPMSPNYLYKIKLYGLFTPVNYLPPI